ncbi:MAG: hypothetical protein HWD58_11955 [Bacteroidota bacterium]|nr:MAG: hypothetical protein HWD58_11955 [Bacteroidota bacterium]
MTTEFNEQTSLSGPASAAGGVVFTETVTTSEAVHPLAAVTITVYVVVAVGFAVG